MHRIAWVWLDSLVSLKCLGPGHVHHGQRKARITCTMACVLCCFCQQVDVGKMLVRHYTQIAFHPTNHMLCTPHSLCSSLYLPIAIHMQYARVCLFQPVWRAGSVLGFLTATQAETQPEPGEHVWHTPSYLSTAVADQPRRHMVMCCFTCPCVRGQLCALGVRL